MTDSLFDHLAGVTAVILFIWSAALVWATIQIRYMLAHLAQERREIARWRRLTETLEARNRERL